VTARASDSMFCIDFVRVTNCFYDYDYDHLIVTQATITAIFEFVESCFLSRHGTDGQTDGMRFVMTCYGKGA